MTALDDAFAPADDFEIKRDQWGRYLLPDPKTGEERSWQRVTTFAKLLSDTYNLDQWRLRQAAIGLTQRPDLLALIASTPEPDTKGKADISKAVDSAIEAAGSSTGANLGTAIHAMTEALDRGHDRPKTTPEISAKLDDYIATMQRHGLRSAPTWIERVLVNPELDVAGTADRFVHCPDGKVRTADLKTSKSMNFGHLEFAMQLAAYATAAGMWNGSGWDDMPANLDTTVGYIIHLPAQVDGPCTIHQVDLVAGIHACRLAVEVRNVRRRKGFLRGVDAPVPEADKDRRLDLLRRCRSLDVERRAAMKAKWPAEIPGLTNGHRHSDLELDAIEAVLEVVDGTRVATEVAEALLKRLQALPGDLLLAVEHQAKEALVPHVAAGWSTEDAETLEGLVSAAENASAERHMTRVRSLAEFDDEEIIENVCAFANVERLDIGSLKLDDLSHERVMAAVETLDLYGTLIVDEAVVIEHHGSKRGLISAARAAGERHGLEVPRAASDIAADPLLASLSFLHTNTQQKAPTP
jgi:hypothetical protein